MKSNLRRSFEFILLTLALPMALAAQQPARMRLHLDPAATEIHYTLKDTLHTVRGTFHMKSGDIDFNTQTGEAKGLIEVETSSGVSGNDSRDGKMKRDYLEVPKFPVATFEAQKVTGFSSAPGAQKVTVAGVFTLHGGSHPLTLEFAVTHDGALVNATTSFKIPYVAWGIKDPSIPFVRVEKEVAVDIVAKGNLQTVP